MSMRKILLGFLFSLLFLFFPKNVFSEGEFITSSSVYYEVQQSGLTTVTHYLTLENAFTDYYATAYSLTLYGIEPKSIGVFQSDTPLEFEQTTQDDGGINIKIIF